MALIAPYDKFSWIGLAIAPIWFMVDILLGAAGDLLGGRTNGARAAVFIALLAGFYAAWFYGRRAT